MLKRKYFFSYLSESFFCLDGDISQALSGLLARPDQSHDLGGLANTPDAARMKRAKACHPSKRKHYERELKNTYVIVYCKPVFVVICMPLFVHKHLVCHAIET